MPKPSPPRTNNLKNAAGGRRTRTARRLKRTVRDFLDLPSVPPEDRRRYPWKPDPGLRPEDVAIEPAVVVGKAGWPYVERELVLLDRDAPDFCAEACARYGTRLWCPTHHDWVLELPTFDGPDGGNLGRLLVAGSRRTRGTDYSYEGESGFIIPNGGYQNLRDALVARVDDPLFALEMDVLPFLPDPRKKRKTARPAGSRLPIMWVAGCGTRPADGQGGRKFAGRRVAACFDPNETLSRDRAEAFAADHAKAEAKAGMRHGQGLLAI